MKQLFLLLTAITLGFAFNPPEGEKSTKKVNIKESQVTWKGYKITGSHEGTLDLKEGNLEFSDGLLSGGTFVVDMTSLQVTDLKGGGAEKLKGHLMSPDFFGVEAFPTATLTITNVVSRGLPGDYKVFANLTIKKTTKPIKFEALIKDNTATAAIKVDRSEFDVRYGSATLLGNLGDNTIYDEFDLNISLVIN
ncbi:MAG: YceI family protein [Bacteroidota bacterium]